MQDHGIRLVQAPELTVTETEFNRVAQLSHAGWGFGIIFGTYALTLSRQWVLLTFIVWTFYSIVKEFWYDERYEEPVVRGNSVLDFFVQTGSAFLALLLLAILGRI